MPDSPVVTPSRDHVDRMFDRIAHRYDLLNRLLSMGTDVTWRKAMVKRLPDTPNLKLLDLATGTADVLLTIDRVTGRVEHGVGVDVSGGMLHYGHEKIARIEAGERLQLLRGDAMRLPLPDSRFDVATISFGIRNVADVPLGLREMHRVLKPGGKALLLEFSLPGNRLLRSLYLFYFRHILPRLGGLLSGDMAAYQYLNKTVETFPYGEAFCKWMREAGFEEVKAEPFTFGIATLYSGSKPSRE